MSLLCSGMFGDLPDDCDIPVNGGVVMVYGSRNTGRSTVLCNILKKHKETDKEFPYLALVFNRIEPLKRFWTSTHVQEGLHKVYVKHDYEPQVLNAFLNLHRRENSGNTAVVVLEDTIFPPECDVAKQLLENCKHLHILVLITVPDRDQGFPSVLLNNLDIIFCTGKCQIRNEILKNTTCATYDIKWKDISSLKKSHEIGEHARH